VITIEANPNGLKPASLERFLASTRRAAGLKGNVNVLIANSSTLRDLNRRFRGKDQATDVLSFPPNPSAPRTAHTAGDIAISAEIAAENAMRMGHSVADEVKVLLLHGVLHLAGYDHEHDNGEMAALEQQLRRKLKLPAALIERANGNRRRRQ
jgi:probable rRNA maturation factor